MMTYDNITANVAKMVEVSEPKLVCAERHVIEYHKIKYVEETAAAMNFLAIGRCITSCSFIVLD